MQIDVSDFVAGARQAQGVAVIIDVFRAFSVTCYAYARGAKRIIPVAEIDKALALRRDHPEYLAIGERGGAWLRGSTSAIRHRKSRRPTCAAETIVHTTSAGTQGLTNASQADIVLTGSLVIAAAICSYIEALAPSRSASFAWGSPPRSAAWKTIFARSCFARG